MIEYSVSRDGLKHREHSYWTSPCVSNSFPGMHKAMTALADRARPIDDLPTFGASILYLRRSVQNRGRADISRRPRRRVLLGDSVWLSSTSFPLAPLKTYGRPNTDVELCFNGSIERTNSRSISSRQYLRSFSCCLKLRSGPSPPSPD